MDVDWAAPQWSLVANVIVIVILAVFDKLCSSNQARWFSVHAFANLLVVLSGARAAFATLAYPIHALDAKIYNDASIFGTGTPWPTIITNSVHVYHMLAFKLNSADYFHHLMFIPTGRCSAAHFMCFTFHIFFSFITHFSSYSFRCVMPIHSSWFPWAVLPRWRDEGVSRRNALRIAGRN